VNSTPSAEQTRRFHWTRFSLRRALIACTLLCGLLGWLGTLLSQVRREKAAVASLRSKGAEVSYAPDDLFLEGIGSQAQRRLLKRIAGYGESRPVDHVEVNKLDIDEAPSVMAHLRYLPDLRELRLVFPQRMGTPLIPRNEVFQPLEGMSRLRRLDWVNAPVDDGVLRYTRGLRHMRELRLGYTGVSDEGLRELRNLRDLRVLYLNNTYITDAGLDHLSSLQHLELLSLNDTKVTSAGIQMLKRHLPKCVVTHESTRG